MIGITTKFPNLRRTSIRLESLLKDLIPQKLTGLLTVTFEECNGIVALDEGEVIDGYEIFNDELLVKDRNARHIVERQKAEHGRIAIYEVNKDVLQSFLDMLQKNSIQNFQSMVQCVIQ
ncbi:MAG: hypothetical protein PVF58_12025 [Candidatus Methanofastidiosia archaeon]|jgi:hypothetical protein